MSDEKEMQAPAMPAPAMPAPAPAPVPPPVYPIPAPAPVYPIPVPAKNETPVPPPVPPPVYAIPVPAKNETPYVYATAAATPANGKQYQEQLLAPCAAGHHDPTTKFGTCGIITAICCFPIGLLCLCADKETRCARCGVLLSGPGL